MNSKVIGLIWATSLSVQLATAWAAESVIRESAKSGREMVLWYRQPAEKWLEAMPMGNGILGAMVFGGIQRERIALNEGGRSEAADASVRIQGADAVTFIMGSATSFVNYRDIGGDPAAACEKILAGVAGKDYATLRRRHEDDFRGLMGRVHLNIGDQALNEQATDARLKSVREGKSDPNLEALCFQCGEPGNPRWHQDQGSACPWRSLWYCAAHGGTKPPPRENRGSGTHPCHPSRRTCGPRSRACPTR